LDHYCYNLFNTKLPQRTSFQTDTWNNFSAHFFSLLKFRHNEGPSASWTLVLSVTQDQELGASYIAEKSSKELFLGIK
jgi:hypothetical protein